MKILITLLLFSLASCAISNKTTKKNKLIDTVEFKPQFISGPSVLLYKTNSNYAQLVPILLSDDKTEIVSYPHPGDLKVDGEYLLPTILNGGYLLDNKGINQNVAFIKLTYEDYAKLQNAPTLKELYNLIIDKNPLTELCNCGNRITFIDIQTQLNKLIDSNTLHKNCKLLKLKENDR
jgi:hypothetical protein